jgi:hypothetical protein
VSLYYTQKLLFELNRDPATVQRFEQNLEGLLADYELTEEERCAIKERDIGLLYVMGVNGQILMHFAALCGYEWSKYIEAMREGECKYGPVRAGLYTRADAR